MRELFTRHPHAIGETYWQHMKCAVMFGCAMIFGGFACLIHAIFPFVFQATGSNCMFRMLRVFINRTPKLEQRVIQLQQVLEQKIKQTKVSE